MRKEGEVLGIFISPDKGIPMISQDKVFAVSGIGLYGDRYAEGKGAYSREGDKVRHVSIISVEAVKKSNFMAEETRRNIVVDLSIDELNSLSDKEFQIAGVKMVGRGFCKPCDRPSELSKKKGFREEFEGSGGIRAEILNDGLIELGTSIGKVEE